MPPLQHRASAALCICGVCATAHMCRRQWPVMPHVRGLVDGGRAAVCDTLLCLHAPCRHFPLPIHVQDSADVLRLRSVLRLSRYLPSAYCHRCSQFGCQAIRERKRTGPLLWRSMDNTEQCSGQYGDNFARDELDEWSADGAETVTAESRQPHQYQYCTVYMYPWYSRRV